MTQNPQDRKIETHLFAADAAVPNNPVLPLVLYRGVLDERARAANACAALFARNGWPDAWQNGIYDHHHYHSTAHEVLGIAAGTARVRLGGENGATVELRAGDVVVIPAGVAHKCEDRSADLLVIGAYPAGQTPDLCRAAKAGVADGTRRTIAAVALPGSDPVYGAAGPLIECWQGATS
jgi:uncharacterized protein YjlB